MGVGGRLSLVKFTPVELACRGVLVVGGWWWWWWVGEGPGFLPDLVLYVEEL